MISDAEHRRGLLRAALGFGVLGYAPGATASAFEPTPFRAVHVAAWETLART